MMNIIRADFYRLRHGKALYVIFGILAVASAILMIVQGVSGNTGNFELLNILTSLVIIFCVPIFTCVAGPIFMDGTTKNEVSWGVSRIKLYLARVIVCTILCVSLLAVYYGVGIAVATPFGGFGDGTENFWTNFLLTFAAQSLMMVAACMLGIFLVFSMKNVVAVVEVFAGIFALPAMIIQFLPIMFDVNMENIMRFLYFDLTTNMVRLGNIGGLETRSILIILAVGAGWLIIPTVIGIIKFQRKEVG